MVLGIVHLSLNVWLKFMFSAIFLTFELHSLPNSYLVSEAEGSQTNAASVCPAKETQGTKQSTNQYLCLTLLNTCHYDAPKAVFIRIAEC